MTLSVHGLSVSYGEIAAIDSVDLEIKAGSTLTVLGASGSGKSTLLRAIAGLEASHGEIFWGEEALHLLPPHRRGIGFVFQDHALFPQRDVLGNVRFGLETPRYNKEDATKKASDLLDRVGLAGFETRHIDELSGGERQRVALARALAPSPRVLLLDEPYGALDRELRDRLMLDVREILSDTGVTVIHVTHDHDEAFALGDIVAILHDGHISQCAPPGDVWEHPRDLRTAKFLGHTSSIRGHVVADNSTGALRVTTGLGEFLIASKHADMQGTTGACQLTWRPEDLSAGLANSAGVDPAATRSLQILGTVSECSFRRGHYLLTLETSEGRVEGTSKLSRPLGKSVALQLNLDAVRAFK